MEFVHPYVSRRCCWEHSRGRWYPLATSSDGSLTNGEPVGAPPPGTVRADPGRQRYGLGGPVHFYADHHRSCLDCGVGYVFTAVEQRRWYEERGFVLDSHPVHCPSCRGRRRAIRDAQRRVEHATAAVAKRPDDAGAHAALAEALVDHRLLDGGNDLSRAIAAARRAIRLDPDSAPGRYWLARALDAHDRPGSGPAATGPAPGHGCR